MFSYFLAWILFYEELSFIFLVWKQYTFVDMHYREVVNLTWFLCQTNIWTTTVVMDVSSSWLIWENIGKLVTSRTTDAQRNSELFGLGKQIGQIDSEAFGTYSAKLSIPILVHWVPCTCYPLHIWEASSATSRIWLQTNLFNHIYKELIIYIRIPNTYLGLGFEFGPQRIRYLSFVCP